MNPAQTGQVLNTIDVLWPTLKLNDRTRHAWALVLSQFDFNDTMQAVTELAAERTTIQVAHIGQRVKRIRRERLATVPELDLIPPAEIADDGALSAQWVRTARDRMSRAS